MNQVQNQPFAPVDAALFAAPASAAGAGTTSATPQTAGDAVASMRYPLPKHVLPEPEPRGGNPDPGPEPKPGSVAAIFDSLIDQLGAMLQSLLGGGSTGSNGGAPGPDRKTTGTWQV